MCTSPAGYEALIQSIFRRFPSVQKEGFSAGAYKPGLERMEAFDRALGHPSRAFRSIHIAGTNGKGSVANLLASALHRCGYRTGLFTSPHLLDFRERMRIDGAMVPKDDVQAFLQTRLPWCEAHDLSFFEITTGMAFKWFADAGVEAAVIETGLGGRLDSTNILRPELAVVTTIGLDHCALLGDSLAQIAGEKAGIFKEGVPALVGETQPETEPVFREKARAFCPLSFADRTVPSLWDRHAEILSAMDLQAAVQAKNLRTVLCAVDLLRPAFPALSCDEAVIDGIVHTARDMDFHGRWEKLSDDPCVIADIGHNPQALGAHFDRLRALLAEGRYASLFIVYGVMADKDLEAILPLFPAEATCILTAPDTPRALPADRLTERFRTSSVQRVFVRPAVADAVALALELARNAPAPFIYIGGSTYVVSEALPLFP